MAIKKKKQEELKPLILWTTAVDKLRSKLMNLFEDIDGAEEEAYSAVDDIGEAKKQLKQALANTNEKQEELKLASRDLFLANKDTSSIRDEIVKIARQLAKLLEKGPQPPKKRKRKKRVMAPVIPFVAPDVLESRSEV